MTILLSLFFLLFNLSLGHAREAQVSVAQGLDTLNKEDSSILQRHDPFYFAYGSHLSKIQLSFKVPMIRDVPLFFGYTQVMFWALNEDSKPFRDQTFNPEFFYSQKVSNWGAIKSFDFSPWNHNSNGKRDADSRSYNKAYIRMNMDHEFNRWILRGSLQASHLYGFDPTNRDITDYIGPMSIRVSLIQLLHFWFDKSELSLQFSPGGKFSQNWDRGGYLAAMSFRLGGVKIVPAFYLQYYSGYAETLLNYNRNVQEFRVGVIF